LLKLRGLASLSDTIYTNIQNVGICLGNTQDDFQLHRFTTREISQKVLGATFWLTL